LDLLSKSDGNIAGSKTVPDEFNPYAEWLGLDSRQSQPTYYQLLGIAPDVLDDQRIRSAAARAMSQVRHHRPGARAQQWARLLDEIAEARRCLTDPHDRADYDRRLAEACQPQGSQGPAATADELTEGDMAEPDVFPAAVGEATASESAAATSGDSAEEIVFEPLAESAESATRGNATRDAQTSAAADPMSPFVGASSEPSEAAGSPAATVPRAVQRGGRPKGLDRRRRRWFTPFAVGGITCGLLLAIAAVGALSTQQEGSDEETPPGEPLAALEPEHSRARVGQVAGDDSATVLPPQQAVDGGASTFASEPAQPRSFKPLDETDKPEPSTVVTVPPTNLAQRDDALREKPPELAINGDRQMENDAPWREQLDAALKSTWDALKQPDFTAAERSLRAAESLAIGEQAAMRVARMQRLLQCARDYDGAIRSHVASFSAAAEIEITDDWIVSVVDAGPNWLCIRNRGQNVTYRIDEMPLGLAAAIGDQALDGERPATQVRRAAFVAIHPRSGPEDLEKARSWLDAAAEKTREAQAVRDALAEYLAVFRD
jgi:hypothetical protein